MLPTRFPQLPIPLPPTCFPHSPPHSPTNLALASRIGSRRVTHRPGDSVELSGGTGRQCRRAVGRHWDSVAELSGTEAVRVDLTTRASPTLMADLQPLTCGSSSSMLPTCFPTTPFPHSPTHETCIHQTSQRQQQSAGKHAHILEQSVQPRHAMQQYMDHRNIS